jgi:hypothetical protein
MVAQKDIFHRVEIGRFVFAGVAGRGDPYITRLDDKMGGDVQLGPSQVAYFDRNPGSSRHPYSGPGYYVAKYDNELRIALPGMTEGQARTLADSGSGKAPPVEVCSLGHRRTPDSLPSERKRPHTFPAGRRI